MSPVYYCISPCCTVALDAFGDIMSKYEQSEIHGYKDIWFLGGALKIHDSRDAGNNNHGFDNTQYFYNQVTFCRRQYLGAMVLLCAKRINFVNEVPL